MKTPYSFTVLRYVHDVVSGEFINVGVVLFAPKTRYLSANCSAKFGRLSKMFVDVDGDHYKKIARYFQTKIEEEGERLVSELPLDELPESVTAFASKILPRDDSSLQFSPEGYGLTENPQVTLEQLFIRYVEKYNDKPEKLARTNDEVWKVYKKPLEEKRVLSKLVTHQVMGKNYDYEFRYSWQNQIWHLNEPISFDLLDSNSVREKANTWLGRITSLYDGKDKFHLNVLLGEPKEESVKKSFIKAKNILHSMPCEHQLISEDEADDFAERLKSEMDAHDR